jgi:hypothetical protein
MSLLHCFQLVGIMFLRTWVQCKLTLSFEHLMNITIFLAIYPIKWANKWDLCPID